VSGRDLVELQSLANASTHARRRAEAMGWQFGPVDVALGAIPDTLTLRGTFTCRCGRPEWYSLVVSLSAMRRASAPRDELDVAAKLQALGSFSREHLLADGFTPEQVDEVERLGWQFDYREEIAQ